MKKIIALALALVMALSMASVAFASELGFRDDTEFELGWGNVYVDEDLDGLIELKADLGVTVEGARVGEHGGLYVDDAATVVMAPGSYLHVDVSNLIKEARKLAGEGIHNPSIDGVVKAADIAKNLKLETEITKGSAMVEKIEYNGKDTVDLKLKENYTLTDIKDLQLTLKIVAKRDFEVPEIGGAVVYGGTETESDPVMTIEKNTVIVSATFGADGFTASTGLDIDTGNRENLRSTPLIPDGPLPFFLGVANATVMVYGEEEADDAEPIDITGVANNNIVYKTEEDEAGYVKFNDTDSLFQITANMAEGEKVFVHMIEDDEDILAALQEKNPEADLSSYTMEGRVAFVNPAEFTLQADYADQYKIYTYDGKNLAPVKTEWDSIEGLYRWNAKEMTSYIISDVELVAAAEETKNPDTGANDVVGVAAALAVTALVAGAAVSLKK